MSSSPTDNAPLFAAEQPGTKDATICTKGARHPQIAHSLAFTAEAEGLDRSAPREPPERMRQNQVKHFQSIWTQSETAIIVSTRNLLDVLPNEAVFAYSRGSHVPPGCVPHHHRYAHNILPKLERCLTSSQREFTIEETAIGSRLRSLEISSSTAGGNIGQESKTA
eukprot:3161831-Rhodomonas_salina.2